VYAFLEIGASDDLTVSLISAGLSRQTSIEVRDLMPNIRDSGRDIITSVVAHANYGKLHKITRNEIEALWG